MVIIKQAYNKENIDESTQKEWLCSKNSMELNFEDYFRRAKFKTQSNMSD